MNPFCYFHNEPIRNGRDIAMKWIVIQLVFAVAVTQTALAGVPIQYNFDDMVDGSIDGQSGWSVYEMGKDSSAFSVLAEVGTSEGTDDRALVVQSSDTPIRCVSGRPARWLSGQTLKVEFDFRIAVDPAKLVGNRPVMVFYLGNSLLNDKARWEARLEATPSGDWVLQASLPDTESERIFAERLMQRSNDSINVSDWFHFVMEIEKLNDMDSFRSTVKILDRNGITVTMVKCTDTNKDKVTMAMWNLSRLYVGFNSPSDQYGLACIDNLEIVAN